MIRSYLTKVNLLSLVTARFFHPDILVSCTINSQILDIKFLHISTSFSALDVSTSKIHGGTTKGTVVAGLLYLFWLFLSTLNIEGCRTTTKSRNKSDLSEKWFLITEHYIALSVLCWRIFRLLVHKSKDKICLHVLLSRFMKYLLHIFYMQQIK